MADDRLAELDGIRGLAASLVLLHHAWVFRGESAIGALAELGWCGVDVFFALSGFLITAGLLRRGLSGFYERRARRILPLYAVVVTAGLLSWWALGHRFAETPLAGPWWAYPLFLSDLAVAWAGEAGPLHLGITWSVAVEEKFYVVWPLLFLLLPRRLLPLAPIAAILVAPWLRMQTDPVSAYVLPWCRMDALAIGALAAMAHARGLRVGMAPALLLWTAIAALAATVGLDRLDPWFAGPGYLLIPAATAATVFAIASGRRVPALAWAPLVALGTWSYGLYLLHPWVWFGVRTAMDAAGLDAPTHLGHAALQLALTAAGSVLAAATSWRWLERPWIERRSNAEALHP